MRYTPRVLITDKLKSYAAANKHVYLDYYSAMLDGKGMLKAEFSEDDLHPNAKGYAIMAPLAEADLVLVADTGSTETSRRLREARSSFSSSNWSGTSSVKPGGFS